MNLAAPGKEKLSRLALIFAAWTFYGLFFASQNYLQAAYLGREADWLSALSVWLTCAYSWAALTPLIVAVARRFSFGRTHWLWAVLVHVPFSLITALTVLAVYTGVRFLIFREAVDYPKLVAGELRITVIIYFVLVGIMYAVDRFSPRTHTSAEPVLIPASFESAGDPRAETGTGEAHPPSTAPKRAFADRFSVRQNGRIVLVNVDEIDLLTSDGNYVSVHVNGRSHLLRETMKAMEQKLDPAMFLRVRRSAIVRIGAIKEMHPMFNGEFEIILTSGKKVASSRRFRKNLDTLLKD